MVTKNRSICKLNSFSAGMLGLFGLDGSVLHIQMSSNTIMLAAISLSLAAATIIIRKIIDWKTVKEFKSKSKNR